MMTSGVLTGVCTRMDCSRNGCTPGPAHRAARVRTRERLDIFADVQDRFGEGLGAVTVPWRRGRASEPPSKSSYACLITKCIKQSNITL